MKNLGIAFCSFRPEQYPEHIRNHREAEYLICLEQLYRVIPDSYDLVIVDNTTNITSSNKCLRNPELIRFLSDKKLMTISDNIGTRNKGMGEIDMLDFVLKNTTLENYENITYITARRIFTCPYFFERTETLKSDALISNPDFLYLNGKFVETHKEGMYNDMIFSMKTEKMVEYANYTKNKIEKLLAEHIGSEVNLFNFIKEQSLTYEWIKWIGLIRNDWEISKEALNINNFHIS